MCDDETFTQFGCSNIVTNQIGRKSFTKMNESKNSATLESILGFNCVLEDVNK